MRRGDKRVREHAKTHGPVSGIHHRLSATRLPLCTKAQSSALAPTRHRLKTVSPVSNVLDYITPTPFCQG